MRQYLPRNLRFARQYTDYAAKLYEELFSGQAQHPVFATAIFRAGIAVSAAGGTPGTDDGFLPKPADSTVITHGKNA
jgi:hypothetical protein